MLTVGFAFGFAYALNRSCMRFKSAFKLIAMLPILVPSLLPRIALIYLFCNQGILKDLLMGQTIFGKMDGGGWAAYWNSIRLAALTAVAGTAVVFIGAYMVEKLDGMHFARGLFQLLAMLPMAIPGMVLGLAYIFFFNNPANPRSRSTAP